MVKLAALCLALSALPALSQSTPACSTTPTKSVAKGSVKASGCFDSGVEGGCYILKDRASGKTYNLFFNGTVPAIRTGIQITGEPHSGMTTCMQGTALDVKTCKLIHLKCDEKTETPTPGQMSHP